MSGQTEKFREAYDEMSDDKQRIHIYGKIHIGADSCTTGYLPGGDLSFLRLNEAIATSAVLTPFLSSTPSKGRR